MFDFPGNLVDVDPEYAAEEGYCLYCDIYCTMGKVGFHETHDGQVVKFYADRFHHAFCKSSDYYLKPKAKDVLDHRRIERVRWIKAMIAGDGRAVQCFEVAKADRDKAIRNRLYFNFDISYVVWLEPSTRSQQCRWVFSTAYPTFPDHIRKYIRGGKRVL